MSIMSSSLLLQLCPAFLVHLIWMILEMGGRWLYSHCFLECCFQDYSYWIHQFFTYSFFFNPLIIYHSSSDINISDNIMPRLEFFIEKIFLPNGKNVINFTLFLMKMLTHRIFFFLVKMVEMLSAKNCQKFFQ